MSDIAITLNGKPAQVGAGATLVDVLATLGIPADRPGVAVALGYDVIPRAEWAATTVSEGAEIEVVTATQGG